MRALVEPFSGIAGDMTVGALLDLGVPIEVVRSALDGLPLTGYSVRSEPASRGAFAGTRFVVEVEEREQPHRSLADVLEALEGGGLPPGVLARAVAVFEGLAGAEGAAHGVPPADVHFHEVGAVDSIVDVVGAAAGLEHLQVTELLATRVRLGTGEVVCRHGRIPVPAPAAHALLRGFPVLIEEGGGETVTPTGAAMLSAWARPLGELERFRLGRSGCGAGSRTDTSLPDLLRVTLEDGAEARGRDVVVEICANVDDLPPEAVAFAVERLLAAGALDAWVVPIVMKKGRPAHLVAALAEPGSAAGVEDAFFRHTSTFGIRREVRERETLARSFETVETIYGAVRVKIGSRGGEVLRRSPEYEDCARLAAEKDVPLAEVYAAALAALR